MNPVYYLIAATVATVFCSPPLPAKAPFWVTGNSLLEHCDGSTKPDCLAYIIGVADGLQAVEQFPAITFDKRAKLICPPTGVTLGQMHDVVLTSLRLRPNGRHFPANLLAAAALTDAFRCPQVRKK
jgi:hypothetical protein